MTPHPDGKGPARPMKLFSRTLIAIAALAATLAVAACGTSEPPMNEKTAREQFQQLMQRPDIDQAAARYEEMYAKVRQTISAAVPALVWKTHDQLTRAGCGSDFGAIDVAGRSDAEHRSLANWVAEGNIPDSNWEHIVSLVRQVAQSYGFDGGYNVTARKGEHEIVFHDQYDAELQLGTADNTTLGLRTGCHLTAAAKQRGALAPLPSY